ncbi:MAG: lipopolysaccharide biosynthesis protein [Hyphomicrobiales bacterium]|nr:lipopolysaccharide biosynthesis protein [Hyphomicrobiales bacterium]
MQPSLLRNTLLYMPAQLLGPLVQFVVIVVWTHLLDPAAFGVVTFVVAAQEMTALIGLYWWSLYMLRFQQRFANETERFRAMDNRMVLVGCLSQIVMAPLCFLAIGAAPTFAMSAAGAAYLISRLLIAHYSEWARSKHRIGAYTFAQLAGPMLGSALSLVAIMAFGATPAVALAAMAFGQAIGAAGLMSALEVRPGRGVFDATIFREATRYGAPLILSGLFGWMSINGVRLLVQANGGVVAVGLLSAGWGLGQRIANVMAMLCTAAAFPLAVDRIESGDREGALRQVSLNGLLMLALLAPAVVGVTMLAHPLVYFIIAEKYRAVTEYTLPLAMAAGALRTFKTHVADQAALLLERTRTITLANFADALVTTLCAAIGLWRYGVVGAAAGACLGAAIASIGQLLYAALFLHLPLRPVDSLKILAATAVMGLALAFVPEPRDVFHLALTIALGAAVYVGAALVMFASARDVVLARLFKRG